MQHRKVYLRSCHGACRAGLMPGVKPLRSDEAADGLVLNDWASKGGAAAAGGAAGLSGALPEPVCPRCPCPCPQQGL